jgi:hypothetical protein
MRDVELYRALLGLTAPWTVADVDVDMAGQRVGVRVEAGPGPYPCPGRGTAGPRYDSKQRRWRHLDTMQSTTWIEADVPRMQCGRHGLKKDDSARIEQKNWTHVRKLLGYVRYDSLTPQSAIHALYRHELRLFQNFFLPSVKLLAKERVGSRVCRRYDMPRTPLERMLASPDIRPEVAAQLQRQRDGLDPFVLARTIEQQLGRFYALANPRHSAPASAPARPAPVRRPVRKRLSIKPSPHLTSPPSRWVTSVAAR